MKHFILAIAAVLMLTGVAQATNNDPKGGNAEAIAASQAVSVSGAAAKASANSTNVNVNAPSQSYEGSYTGSYSGQQNINIENPRQSPAVVAPALTSAGTGVCLGSISGGVSVMGAGASLGMTKVDKGCERRSGAALLYQMGYRDAALRLLMNDDEIREAMGVAAPVKPSSAVKPTEAAVLDQTNFGQR